MTRKACTEKTSQVKVSNLDNNIGTSKRRNRRRKLNIERIEKMNETPKPDMYR